jgi:hypothetical protein
VGDDAERSGGRQDEPPDDLNGQACSTLVRGVAQRSGDREEVTRDGEASGNGSARRFRRVRMRLLAVVGLAGMAYCHIRDVGMKFDEHVYYMASLFCCNIAASIALIPAVLWSGTASSRARAYIWGGAALLAALTIVGFLWSRTIGFPQMADHVGEWDALGLTSVGFEALVIGVSAWALTGLLREQPAAAFVPTLGVR